MSPTLTGLQRLINICEDFAAAQDIKFNGKKSQFIVFNAQGSPATDQVTVCGTVVHAQDTVNHLGHMIPQCVSRSSNDYVVKNFYGQLNVLMSKFGNLPSVILNKLFYVHCTSLYGLLLSDFRKLDKMSVAWRKSLRKIWRLHPRTHCNILPSLSDKMCCTHMTLKRFVNFIKVLYNHPSSFIPYMMKCNISNTKSLLHNNLTFCTNRLHCDTDIEQYDIVNHCRIECTPLESIADIAAIKELCAIRDGQYTLTSLNFNDVSELLTYLCIN